MNNAQTAPKVTKETKNKIRVDFERTSFWTRFKLKYLSFKFVKTVAWVIFRLVLLIGISYVILSPVLSKIFCSFMGREDFVDVTVRLIPKNFSLDIYKAIWTDLDYVEALVNTLGISLLLALLQTFVCCVIAYGLAKSGIRIEAPIPGKAANGSDR